MSIVKEKKKKVRLYSSDLDLVNTWAAWHLSSPCATHPLVSPPGLTWPFQRGTWSQSWAFLTWMLRSRADYFCTVSLHWKRQSMGLCWKIHHLIHFSWGSLILQWNSHARLSSTESHSSEIAFWQSWPLPGPHVADQVSGGCWCGGASAQRDMGD